VAVRAGLTFHLTHASNHRDYSDAIDLNFTNAVDFKTLVWLYALECAEKAFRKAEVG
jgi:hypothetical protein